MSTFSQVVQLFRCCVHLPRVPATKFVTGLEFKVLPSTFDESTLDKAKFATPADYVEASALSKVGIC
jgi:hypothetical protein